MDEIKCSNPKCGVPITKRQARLTEIFMGRGNPLCLSCYDGHIYDERTKIIHDEREKRLKEWTRERAEQKVKKDGMGGHEDAETQ